jgi:hypothetical protein
MIAIIAQLRLDWDRTEGGERKGKRRKKDESEKESKKEGTLRYVLPSDLDWGRT